MSECDLTKHYHRYQFLGTFFVLISLVKFVERDIFVFRITSVTTPSVETGGLCWCSSLSHNPPSSALPPPPKFPRLAALLCVVHENSEERDTDYTSVHTLCCTSSHFHLFSMALFYTSPVIYCRLAVLPAF